jgi:glycosyltransferase involved in cell wall biosynthesis
MAASEPSSAVTAGGTVGFSVVVPSYNQGRFLGETLDSLLSQCYPRLEVIVVDGGSTDQTLDLLRGRGDAIRWISEPDAGQADALRKGFALAKGEWLAWLNSDDVQMNDALRAVAEAIDEHPEAEVVVGRGCYIDEEGQYLRPYPTIALGTGVDVRREMFEKGYMAQPSVYFRRTVYEAAGGVDVGLQFVMDYDLWVRLAARGCRFVGVDREISGNRWHEGAKTASQPLRLLAEAVQVQRRQYGRVSAYFVQAVSDHLYHELHARPRHGGLHLLYRTLYFKSVWAWLNMQRPFYCLAGLLTRNIAKSGPVVGDRLTIGDISRMLVGAVRRRVG